MGITCIRLRGGIDSNHTGTVQARVQASRKLKRIQLPSGQVLNEIVK